MGTLFVYYLRIELVAEDEAGFPCREGLESVAGCEHDLVA